MNVFRGVSRRLLARGPMVLLLGASNDDDALVAKIRDGVPNTAMQAFKGTLDEQQIWQLVAYIRTAAANLKDKPVFVPDPNNLIIKSERQEVVFEQFGRVRAVTTGPDGLLYVLLQNPTGSGTGVGLSASTPGMVIRLVPASQN